MHDLIKDNQVLKSHDFESDTPPILHKNKGVWVPRTVINPFYDPAIQIKTLAQTVNKNSTTWEYVISDIPLETIKANKLSEIADARYQAEIAGISMNGTTIKTDRESQALITGAYAASLINPKIKIDWKGGNGWVSLNATAIAGICVPVTVHVQTCFSNEKKLMTLVEAAKTAVAVLSVAWAE